MSSHSRTAEREEERRLNMRTLVIASAASAAAALLTSQLWIAGTWIAAAMTPVIVSLVSEMLNRPTERIARSITSDRKPLAAAGGAGRPAAPGADPLPDRATREPAAGAREARPPRDLGSEAPIRVYRAGEATSRSDRRAARVAAGGGRAGGAPGIGAGAADRGPGSRGPVLGAPGMPPAGRGRGTRHRKIAFGAVFATAAIAFVIAVAALTLPELVAGGSVGKNDGRTTFFGGKKGNDSKKEQAPQDTTEEEQPAPEEEQQPTTPEEETTPPAEEETPPAEEAPQQQQQQQAPAPGEPLPETTPVPPTTQP
jgi:hypothetical protein